MVEFPKTRHFIPVIIIPSKVYNFDTGVILNFYHVSFPANFKRANQVMMLTSWYK